MNFKLNKLVVRFLNGVNIKGNTSNFSPYRDDFNLLPIESEYFFNPLKITLEDIEAIFFVKDFKGNSKYEEMKNIPENKNLSAKKITVILRSGEELKGGAVVPSKDRIGFFLYPMDTNCNNHKIFIIQKNVSSIKLE